MIPTLTLLTLKGEVLMGTEKVELPRLVAWPVCLACCFWAETGKGGLGNRCEIEECVGFLFFFLF